MSSETRLGRKYLRKSGRISVSETGKTCKLHHVRYKEGVLPRKGSRNTLEAGIVWITAAIIRYETNLRDNKQKAIKLQF